MKQGIDPVTHKPLPEVQVKQKDESLDRPKEKVQTLSTLTVHDPIFLVNSIVTDDNIGLVDSSGGVKVPSSLEYSLPFFEFQAGLNPHVYNPSLMMSQYHSNSRQVAPQNHIGMDLMTEFSSMPSLTNFENFSSKECSSNVSNISGYSSGITENEDFHCLFQFHVKSEDDLKPDSWQHLMTDYQSSVNLTSYQLTSLSEDFPMKSFGTLDQI